MIGCCHGDEGNAVSSLCEKLELPIFILFSRESQKTPENLHQKGIRTLIILSDIVDFKTDHVKVHAMAHSNTPKRYSGDIGLMEGLIVKSK